MALLAFVTEISLSTWVVFLLVICLTKWYLSRLPWKNLPPGPPSVPILGSLPFLEAKNIFKTLSNLAVKYGNIYTLYLGPERAVVLNGYAVTKEALVKHANAFAGRPFNFLTQEFPKGKGIASSQGHLWQEQRRYVLHVLRDIGLGKHSMEDLIIAEVSQLIKVLQDNMNKPYDLQETLQKAVTNVITSFAFGKSWEYDDPVLIHYATLTRDIFDQFGTNNPLTIFPWLKYIPGDYFGYNKLKSEIVTFENQFYEWIDDHKQKINNGDIPNDLIGHYLIEMSKQKSNPDTTFTDFQLMRIMAELFDAGTDTTSNTLSWGFLYLLDQPAVQQKVYEEIDDVIGSSRMVTMQDRIKMPYTEAVLSEIQRIASVVPLGIPHATLEDVKLGGYDIPKGTTVLINMSKASLDPEIWPDPDKFKPERFLNEDGSYRKREEHFPFSMGKRICLGEGLAKMELFLFFTSILQKFKVSFPEGMTEVDLEGVYGLTHHPKSCQVLFALR